VATENQLTKNSVDNYGDGTALPGGAATNIGGGMATSGGGTPDRLQNAILAEFNHWLHTIIT